MSPTVTNGAAKKMFLLQKNDETDIDIDFNDMTDLFTQSSPKKNKTATTTITITKHHIPRRTFYII